jgi:nitroreductase
LDVFATITTRRSIRRFKSDDVSDEVIMKIIDAARWAPSSGNMQPWEFIIIRQKSTINMIMKLFLKRFEEFYTDLPKTHPRYKSPEYIKEKLPLVKTYYKDAPVFIAVFADSTKTQTPLICGSAAVENLMLTVHALGLGTVWLHLLPEKEMKELLDVPNHYRFIACAPIGYPKENPSPPKRRPLEEMIHYEKFEDKNGNRPYPDSRKSNILSQSYDRGSLNSE